MLARDVLKTNLKEGLRKNMSVSNQSYGFDKAGAETLQMIVSTNELEKLFNILRQQSEDTKEVARDS